VPLFDLAIQVPRERRYVETLRAIVEQASRQAGWTSDQAAAFAARAEGVAEDLIAQPGPERLSVHVHVDGGPLEVRIDSQILTLHR